MLRTFRLSLTGNIVLTVTLMKRPLSAPRLGPRKAYYKSEVGIVNTYCLSKGRPLWGWGEKISDTMP